MGADDGKESASSSDNETDMIDDDDLPYCRAVLTESIRLHMPVLFTTRVLSKDLTLDTGYDDGYGYETRSRATLLRGTRIFINPAIIHRDERNFERANEFLPERWVRWDDASGRWVDRDDNEAKKYRATMNGVLGSTIEEVPTPPPPSLSSKYTAEHAQADTISAANPANFFSFSDGARNCVGRRLAIMESTICIAVLFRDMCVAIGEEDFELVKERRFVTVVPVSLPIVFWKR